MIILKILLGYLIYFVAVAALFGIMLFIEVKFGNNDDEKERAGI